MSALEELDLSQSLDRETYDRRLKELKGQLAEAALKMHKKKRTAVFVFEGKDAAGKGGAIRRLTQSMIPELYSVIPVAAPTPPEKARHYLWRFRRDLPEEGRLVIFDRSWYGRVLVERVEGFCTEEEWKRSYQEINEMETAWHEVGIRVAKFWLHIDQDEQLRRFEERARSPMKQWKLTDEDWRNREKWPLYRDAVEEMISRTSSEMAPWFLIEGNDKLFARIKVLQLALQTLRQF
ncbi:MAG: UDP-galactose-lipid carrier transferase [Leptospiraceae bacterium]|nr:UDP-galactose-lipid carrier transferase [Leptospiraceae bacterium]